MIGQFQVAVTATIEKSEKILVTKRSKDVANEAGLWETVSGRVEQTETSEKALMREIKEELGEVEIKIGNPYNIFKIRRDDGFDLIGISYICEYISGNIKLNEEHTEYRWIKPEDFENYDATDGMKAEIRKFIGLKNNSTPNA